MENTTMTKVTLHRAILIDPFAHKITEIETIGGFQDIRSLLSEAGHSCNDFDSIGLGGRDAMFVDGEAGLTGRLPAFEIKGRLIYGKAVILGHTPNGNPAKAKTKLATVEQAVTFQPRAKAMLWKLTDGEGVYNDPDVEAAGRAVSVVQITEQELLDRMFGRS